MTLEDLRKKVLFHNTVDVWIALCEERNVRWDSEEGYGKFIKLLHAQNPDLKKYTLCVSDAESEDAHERKKAQFATSLADENIPTYTVRLSLEMLAKIRAI